VTDDAETKDVADGNVDAVSTTGTELLLKTPEKLENVEEIGTEFLLGDTDREASAAEKSVTSSTRRRKLRHVDAGADGLANGGPGREMNDITADALSIQPTGYTLETAHVRLKNVGHCTSYLFYVVVLLVFDDLLLIDLVDVYLVLC